VFNIKFLWVTAFQLLTTLLGSAQIIDTVAAGKQNALYYVDNNPNLIFNWEVEDGTIISGQGSSSITINWTNLAGIKQIKVYSNPLGSCYSDTSLAYVLVEEMEDIYLPNSFTPNGDGLNDFFGPVLNAAFIKSYSLTILNRWGNIIYESNNPNEKWDGKDAGGNTLNGVFLCLLNITKTNNKEIYSKKLINIIN